MLLTQLVMLQDKVGPFARSAADAAVVLDVIRGRDPGDPSSFDTHLDDPFGIDALDLTVGYLPNTPPIVSYTAKHTLPTFVLHVHHVNHLQAPLPL